MTSTSTEQDKSEFETAIFGTETGPNLSREDFTWTYWLTKVQPIRAQMAVAGHTTLCVEGVERPQLGIERHVRTAAYGVASKLPITMIFETALTDEKMKRAKTNN